MVMLSGCWTGFVGTNCLLVIFSLKAVSYLFYCYFDGDFEFYFYVGNFKEIKLGLIPINPLKKIIIMSRTAEIVS